MSKPDGGDSGLMSKRRAFLAAIGAAGLASVASADVESGGLSTQAIAQQYVREQYTTSPRAAFDPSVLEPGELFWVTDDGEIGVWDGSGKVHPGFGSAENPVGESHFSAVHSESAEFTGGGPNDFGSDTDHQGNDARGIGSAFIDNVGFKAGLSENVDIVDDTATVVPFDAIHSNSDIATLDSSTGEITVQENGWYLLTGMFQFQLSDGDDMQATIYVSGDNVAAVYDSATSAFLDYISVPPQLIELGAGDAITVEIRQASGAAAEMYSQKRRTNFSVVKLG